VSQVERARPMPALTGLRGLAAWYVVLFHTRVALGGTLPDWLLAGLGKGYLAVDFFFILSGFVLWHTYGERLGGTGWRGAAQFLWRRVARIWPLHGVVLAGFVALAAVLASTGRDTAPYPWSQLPLHILLLQNWGFVDTLVWNVPSWSISCEMAAYLTFPAMVTLWPRLSPRAVAGAVVALLVLIWAYFAGHGTQSLGYDVEHLGLMRCWLEFALGNGLGMAWRLSPGVDGLVVKAGASLAAILGAAWAFALPETAFVPACFFVGLILTLALGHSGIARILGGRALHYLGEISYSTYLVHALLFVVFKLAFVRGPVHLGLGQLAAYLALVLACSAALYTWIEKPAQRWLNGLFRPSDAAVKPSIPRSPGQSARASANH
jgi:peptidoglycan/LPS O-acetylase OafA/YrhL